MVTPDPRMYLLHIRDCCERVVECTALRTVEQPRHISFWAPWLPCLVKPGSDPNNILVSDVIVFRRLTAKVAD